MALIICPECGRERVSDTAPICPECGFAIMDYFENRSKAEEQLTSQMIETQIVVTKKSSTSKKDSMLSIIACVFSGVVVIFSLPAILAIPLVIAAGIIALIDLCKAEKEYRHIGSIFALIIAAIVLLLLFT